MEYQTNEIEAGALAVTEKVSVAMAEIAEDMREGLLELTVGAGLQVMGTWMEVDATAVCGRAAGSTRPRRGTGPGAALVTVGGRTVGVDRPRVRSRRQR